MTAAASTPAVEMLVPSPGSRSTEWVRPPVDRGLLATALALALLMVPTAIAMLVDPREFLGLSVWVKPLKFELSLGVHVATLAWFYAYLPARVRDGWRGALATRLMIAVPVIELGYIAFHASRAEASHYNLSTPLNTAFYAAMGVGAVLLVLVPVAMGASILLAGEKRGTPLFRFAVGLGLVLGGTMGLVTGFALGAHGSHWVGNAHSDAGGLPLLGWSRTVGDLRAAHFLGLHIMQALPIAGWFLRDVRPSWGKPMVVTIGLFLVSFSVAALVEAFRGMPFIA